MASAHQTVVALHFLTESVLATSEDDTHDGKTRVSGDVAGAVESINGGRLVRK